MLDLDDLIEPGQCKTQYFLTVKMNANVTNFESED